MAVELTDHLGHEQGVPGPATGSATAGAARNRSAWRPRRSTWIRRSHATATPLALQTVRKGQRRLDGVHRLVMGLYARGMTVRDEQAQLQQTCDLHVSQDLISKISDGVLEEVREWQARPLDRVYPVIFLNAIVCKVRHEDGVRNRAAHLAVGVDADGNKEVLGIWVDTTEGAKLWLRYMRGRPAASRTSWWWSATA
jgi:putative transposase